MNNYEFLFQIRQKVQLGPNIPIEILFIVARNFGVSSEMNYVFNTEKKCGKTASSP